MSQPSTQTNPKTLSPPDTKRPSEYVAEGWCQGIMGLTYAGGGVGARSPLASSVCLFGAVSRWALVVPGDQKVSNYLAEATMLVRKRYGYDSLSTWNDKPGRTKEEVVSLLQEVERTVLDNLAPQQEND